MDRDKKPSTELTEVQLEVLIEAYCWSKQYVQRMPCADVTTSVTSAALERKDLVTQVRQGFALSMRITKKGSRLLATRYPLETIYKLAGCIERAQDDGPYTTNHPVGEMRRAMRHMLLQLSPEQYPELLISKVPVIKELAIRQWEVMQSEAKRTSN